MDVPQTFDIVDYELHITKLITYEFHCEKLKLQQVFFSNMDYLKQMLVKTLFFGRINSRNAKIDP